MTLLQNALRHVAQLSANALLISHNNSKVSVVLTYNGVPYIVPALQVEPARYMYCSLHRLSVHASHNFTGVNRIPRPAKSRLAIIAAFEKAAP